MEKYTLVRKIRKTLTMKMDKDGNITVFAPLYLPQSQVEKFILEHAAWIERKRKQLAARNPLPVLTMKEGERIPIFGKEYVLKLWHKYSVEKTEKGEIYLPASNPKNALIRYYGQCLKGYLTSFISTHAREMGVMPTKISVNSARTRWGSCSGKNTLNFSFRLAMCDTIAVEYVAVHELCHIRHKNHSKAFWQEVEKYYPNYKEAKLYLKQKSYFTEII